MELGGACRRSEYAIDGEDSLFVPANVSSGLASDTVIREGFGFFKGIRQQRRAFSSNPIVRRCCSRLLSMNPRDSCSFLSGLLLASQYVVEIEPD